MRFKRIRRYFQKRTIKKFHNEFEMIYCYEIPFIQFELYLQEQIEVIKFNMAIMDLKIKKLGPISKRDIFKMIHLEFRRYKRALY